MVVFLLKWPSFFRILSLPTPSNSCLRSRPQHSAVDASDGLHSLTCFERTICDTNKALASRSLLWGFPGAFLANSTSSVISKVVAKAFTNDGESYQRAIEAGNAGRSGVNCEAAYSSCQTLEPRHRVPTVDVNTVVRQHLDGMT